MVRSRILFAASSALALALIAWSTSDEPTTAARSVHGPAQSLGNGTVRTYVTLDPKGAPLEIGLALSERALHGLPSSGSGHHDGSAATHEFLLELPKQHATPFKFVELNWNPAGHEPEGVYQDVPHFDFHFYTITKPERDRIVPSDPQFAAKANNLPSGAVVPPFTAVLGPPGVPPAGVAVPKMGVHWVDMRSSELQRLLGKPEAYKPFTATFIHGSWDGQFHFWEPMITRAHLLEKKTTTDPAVRDQIIPIATPARYQSPGYYPSAYRITWDPQAKEYRVALTGLAKRG